MRVHLKKKSLSVDVLPLNFSAERRGWLSAERVGGQAFRDGDSGHPAPAQRAREPGGRQPAEDAH